MGKVMIDPDVMILRVRHSPDVSSERYFQDSPLAATQVTDLFHIVRLRASEQSSAASMLGRHAISWMANTISPDVGEWHVPDPNSPASRKAPDYFAIPHGDGWIEAMRVARGDTPSSTRTPRTPRPHATAQYPSGDSCRSVV